MLRKGKEMTISFSAFLSQLVSNPALAVTVLLTLGVILVNGWTDAPNAIATCVSTRAIRPEKAIIMAAVFNFLGVFVMTMINAGVASTIYNLSLIHIFHIYNCIPQMCLNCVHVLKIL